MKIILTDGTELDALMATGETVHVQGADRDSLTFVFDESYSMDELDELFCEENCEVIKIVSETEVPTGEDEVSTQKEEYIHKGYVIRVELTKNLILDQKATSESDEVTVTRIKVTMAQRTYMETKMVNMQEDMITTQLALVEQYEENLALQDEVTNTQLALAEVYEQMLQDEESEE